MATVRYSFTLDAIKDADLVRWLELQPGISSTIRDALRAYAERPCHADLDAKLNEVLDALRNVQVVTGDKAATPEQGEPARAVAGLDAMLKKFGG